jgi:hypothetical protein
MNAMLELAKRNLPASGQTVSKFNNDLNFVKFVELTPEDITGSGRIKPIAARHFAEQAELVQNITSFYSSAVGQDELVKVHFSGLQMAKVVEDVLNLKDYNVVQPYVRISEQSDVQRRSNAAQEQVGMEAQTASGLTPDDHDLHTSPPQVKIQGATNDNSPLAPTPSPVGNKVPPPPQAPPGAGPAVGPPGAPPGASP